MRLLMRLPVLAGRTASLRPMLRCNLSTTIRLFLFIPLSLQNKLPTTGEKELLLHAWCIMSNHLHLIVAAKKNHRYFDIKNFAYTKNII